MSRASRGWYSSTARGQLRLGPPGGRPCRTTHRGPLPGGARRGRALRELLPQGVPPGRAARRLDPLHGAQAARARCRTARSGSRCSTEPPRDRARTRRRCPDPSAGGGEWIRVGGGVDARQARRWGPSTAREWDLRFSSLRAAALSTCRAPGCTARRCPRTKLLSPLPAARFGGSLRVGRPQRRGRRLARDDRPQLGRRARRALDLAARR